MVDNSSTSQETKPKIFLFALCLYVFIWIAGFIFLWREFGFGLPFVLSIIAALPFMIAARLYLRMPEVEKLELAALFIVLCCAGWGISYVIYIWYYHCLDRSHVWSSRCIEVNKRLHEDPDFKKLELSEGTKGGIELYGSVETPADFERLKQFLDQHDIAPWLNITVTSETESTNKAKAMER